LTLTLTVSGFAIFGDGIIRAMMIMLVLMDAQSNLNAEGVVRIFCAIVMAIGFNI
jgi:hypothetical protein